MTRPPQDVDVLAVLDFELLVLRLLVFIPDVWSPSTKACMKTRASAMTKRMGKRDSKIQDGEDVDVLRSPGYDSSITRI